MAVGSQIVTGRALRVAEYVGRGLARVACPFCQSNDDRHGAVRNKAAIKQPQRFSDEAGVVMVFKRHRPFHLRPGAELRPLALADGDNTELFAGGGVKMHVPLVHRVFRIAAEVAMAARSPTMPPSGKRYGPAQDWPAPQVGDNGASA